LSASCLLSLLLTPPARDLARRFGLVDRPDGRRKLQREAVPMAGGLAILVSSVVVLTVALLVPGPQQEVLAGPGPALLGLLLGSVIICGVGVADDAFKLRGRHKLVGQLAAVAVVMSFGVNVHFITLFGSDLQLGPLAIPFTAFWLLGAINSLNL